jgi:hypothetical protein
MEVVKQLYTISIEATGAANYQRLTSTAHLAYRSSSAFGAAGATNPKDAAGFVPGPAA